MLRQLLVLNGLVFSSLIWASDVVHPMSGEQDGVFENNWSDPLNRHKSEAQDGQEVDLLSRRYEEQFRYSSRNFVLIPHHRNYILPVSFNWNPNNEPYELGIASDPRENIDHAEIKFQLSVKTPLLKGVIYDNDQVFFGMTLISWWQAYNADISAPFRETNYSPEVFWITPVGERFNWLDLDYFALGVVHQSNGRSNLFSRSWNRAYVQMFWEHNRWAIVLEPWWRFEEDEKDTPLSASGDDNPDIMKYMGYFQANAIYRDGKSEYGIMIRNNLRSDNKGAIQLEWSYPFHEQLRVYVQYFNGYGESLIDYDASVNRIGVGVLLNTLL